MAQQPKTKAQEAYELGRWAMLAVIAFVQWASIVATVVLFASTVASHFGITSNYLPAIDEMKLLMLAGVSALLTGRISFK